MYEETEHRFLHMSMEEFKTWEVPTGWHIVRMGGEWQRSAPSVNPGAKEWYFDIRVTIEKGVSMYERS
jgi:starvation-inducible outer membrane lipoprotein